MEKTTAAPKVDVGELYDSVFTPEMNRVLDAAIEQGGPELIATATEKAQHIIMNVLSGSTHAETLITLEVMFGFVMWTLPEPVREVYFPKKDK